MSDFKRQSVIAPNPGEEAHGVGTRAQIFGAGIDALRRDLQERLRASREQARLNAQALRDRANIPAIEQGVPQEQDAPTPSGIVGGGGGLGLNQPGFNLR